MPANVVVPQMGESITEGIIGTWLVRDGAYVNDGDALFELETDKISTEVPAPASGRLQILAAEGATVAIDALVATIDTEAISPHASDDPEDDDLAPSPSTTQHQPALESTAPQGVRPDQATPAARALLREHGISPDAVPASGRKGHITKGDVLAFIERDRSAGATVPAAGPAANATPPATEAKADDAVHADDAERERMSPLRQRISTRLVQAQHTAAILTTFNEIDMSAAIALRRRFKERFNDKHAVGLGFMSFFARATIAALQAYPLLNARIEGLDIVRPHHVHLGIAVGTEKGLMVPVLKQAETMGFAAIEHGIRDFAARARTGNLKIPDLEGGTFTITNGGVYGSLMSTPILNPPQSGILGMHTIKERPVAVDGEVVIRPMMYVALSYDHRIVDGAEAVGFLVRIKELVEEPERLLFDL